MTGRHFAAASRRDPSECALAAAACHLPLRPFADDIAAADSRHVQFGGQRSPVVLVSASRHTAPECSISSIFGGQQQQRSNSLRVACSMGSRWGGSSRKRERLATRWQQRIWPRLGPRTGPRQRTRSIKENMLRTRKQKSHALTHSSNYRLHRHRGRQS